MGLISSTKAFPPNAADKGPGRDLWNQVFGSTTKEDGSKFPRVRQQGGRTLVGADASVIRLIDSLRSRAPGTWSDDRWEQERHFTGIAYVAIHRICEMMGQAEFAVYERDTKHQDGKRPVTEDHPAYGLVQLLERPNAHDTFGDLMYRFSQQLRLTGTALTWMVPNKVGVPMELYPIPTALAIPQAVTNPDYPHGYYRIQPVYPYGPFSSSPTPNTAVGAPIPAEWMMRFKYPHPILWYDGYSPLTGLRLQFDVIEAIDRSQWYSMKREFKPNVVLEMPDVEEAQPYPETEIERLRVELSQDHQGQQNVGKLLVTPPGGKIGPFGTNPIDMDYKEGWEQKAGFLMGGLGITKQAAGMIDESSYASLFATLKQLDWTTLAPDCNRIAQQMTRQLAPFFGDNIFIEIRTKRIDDHDVRNGRITLAMNAKAITKNEVRKELGLEITKEEWGEDFAGEESGGDQGTLERPEIPGSVEKTSEAVQRESASLDQSFGEAGGEGEKEPAEMQSPGTGSLGRGSLGPRKSLNGFAKRIDFLERDAKSVRNTLRKTARLADYAARNGRH